MPAMLGCGDCNTKRPLICNATPVRCVRGRSVTRERAIVDPWRRRSGQSATHQTARHLRLSSSRVVDTCACGQPCVTRTTAIQPAGRTHRLPPVETTVAAGDPVNVIWEIVANELKRIDLLYFLVSCFCWFFFAFVSFSCYTNGVQTESKGSKARVLVFIAMWLATGSLHTSLLCIMQSYLTNPEPCIRRLTHVTVSLRGNKQ